MREFSTLPLTDIAALIRDGAATPTAVARSYLARIDSDEFETGSYLLVTPESALDHAAQADAEQSSGLYRGPLHGMPIALKDLYEVQGQRTTAGSQALRNHISTVTSTAVAKLLAAGAVILGKLNMHEWALGVIGDNPHYGICRNPWDIERICGGSSSGSAAAVAAGLCAGALGSDTRGSVRIPAALCGIVGLKPTYGRVSLHGVIPLSWSLDHAGPMSRRVEDVAHLLTVIAGYDPLDPYSVDRPVDDYHGVLKDGVRGWRVAYDSGSYTSDPAVTDPQVLVAYHQTVHTFKELGATVHGVDMSFLSPAMLLSRQLVASDAAAFHETRLQTSPDLFGEDVLFRLRNDPPPTPMAYAHARHEGVLLNRRMVQFFEEYDVLLLPTVPMPAVCRDDKAVMDKGRTHYSRFTSPFNLAGVPALSLPCGFSTEGLPIGLQIIGGQWREAAVLRAAYAYESATDWHTRRPAR